MTDNTKSRSATVQQKSDQESWKSLGKVKENHHIGPSESRPRMVVVVRTGERWLLKGGAGRWLGGGLLCQLREHEQEIK